MTADCSLILLIRRIRFGFAFIAGCRLLEILGEMESFQLRFRSCRRGNGRRSHRWLVVCIVPSTNIIRLSVLLPMSSRLYHKLVRQMSTAVKATYLTILIEERSLSS